VAEFSFDVVSEFESAELTNALDQARREVQTRFDFRDTGTVFDLQDKVILIESASEDRAKAALQVLGDQAGQSALDFRPPKFVPLLNGKAWFMPAVVGWMALQDRLASRKATE